MKIFLKSRGFTMVELLVVVTIMIILTGVIINSLSGSRAKARDAQRVSDLGQLQLALALFVDRCGEYPTQQNPLTNASTNASRCPTINLGMYINVPRPPAGASQTDYDYTVYRVSGTGNRINYVLHAKLEKPNAAVGKSLAASAIYDPSSSINAAPYGWGQAADAPPYNACSNADTSVDYCVGPN